MTFQVLTFLLVFLHGFAVGDDIKEREPTEKTVRELNAVVDHTEDASFEVNRNDRSLALKALVNEFCFVISRAGKRSVVSGLDLDDRLEVQVDRRVVPVLVSSGKALCAKKTAPNIVNEVKTFCRKMNQDKRELDYFDDLQEERDLSHQTERRDLMGDLIAATRKVCEWLRLNGRDVQYVEELFSDTESLVQKRQFGETW